MKYCTSLIIVPLILFGTINLNAQHLSCDDIQLEDLICDFELLNGFTGTMPSENSPGAQPAPLCPDGGAPHNISWFAFVAPEGNYSITVTPNACSGSTTGVEGVQIGLYTDCSFVETVYCNSECSTNPVSIPSSVLESGNIYYLFIDGCSGTVCDYTFDLAGTFTDNLAISGTTFIDFDANGIQNDSEPDLKNVNISLNPGNTSVLTNDDGKFLFEDFAEGDYTLTATISEGDWVDNEIELNISSMDLCGNIEIGFVPIEGTIPNVLLSVTNSIARCDWETRFYISIENTNSNPFEGTFDFEFDELTSFFSSDIPDIVVNGNIAEASTGILEPFENKEFIITLLMPLGRNESTYT